MSLVAVDGLACGYDRPVLTNINLSIERGESVLLLGPNGSGKSTLLKTLAGLVPPLAGRIRMEGADLGVLKPREVARLVASVPQDEAVPFAFTARQIVTMGRLARSDGLVDTPEDHAATAIALRHADCEAFADRSVDRTSGGERQRILIARALAQDAPLLLMDEPSAHLDASHQAWLAHLVRELAAEGRGVVVALHDLSLASAVASRAILIARGGILMDAPTEEVLASDRLDAAFGTTFDRLKTASGRVLVVPKVG